MAKELSAVGFFIFNHKVHKVLTQSSQRKSDYGQQSLNQQNTHEQTSFTSKRFHVNNRMQAQRSLRMNESEHNPQPRMGLQISNRRLRSYLRMNDAPTTIYYLEEVTEKNEK